MVVVRDVDDDALLSVHYLFIELFTLNYSPNFTHLSHTHTPWFKMMRKFETFKQIYFIALSRIRLEIPPFSNSK